MFTKNRMKWNFRFLEMAGIVAGWSKDSTQVGAVIVDRQDLIISTGYNGFPKEIQDTVSRLEDRDLKNHLVVHAEMNAILNSRNIELLSEAIMYVSGVPPCTMCTACIIRVGIKTVVLWSEDIEKCHEPWLSRWKISQQMFNEAEVNIYLI